MFLIRVLHLEAAWAPAALSLLARVTNSHPNEKVGAVRAAQSNLLKVDPQIPEKQAMLPLSTARRQAGAESDF